MIHLLENGKGIKCPKAEGFIEAKIYASYLSYGSGYPFLTFWQGKEGNKITSAICKFEDTIFLSVGKDADFSELSQFLSVIGFSHLQAEADTLKALGLLDFDEYVVLKSEKRNGCRTLFEINEKPPLKEVYGILFGKKEENIALVDFEGWYADLSHRIRHGTAASFTLEGKSAAILSHITEKTAVLSGIATLPSQRRKGYASSLLGSLEDNFTDKNIFTATDEKTAEFYIKNGFSRVQSIGIYKAGV